jgi:hypothetical protein
MTETVEALFRSQGVLARWKGFEASADENALKGDKPKRRRKLAAASAAPAVEAKEEATEETADTPAEEPAEEKSEE